MIRHPCWIIGNVLSRSDGDFEDCAARLLQHPASHSAYPSCSGMPSSESTDGQRDRTFAHSALGSNKELSHLLRATLIIPPMPRISAIMPSRFCDRRRGGQKKFLFFFLSPHLRPFSIPSFPPFSFFSLLLLIISVYFLLPFFISLPLSLLYAFAPRAPSAAPTPPPIITDRRGDFFFIIRVPLAY